MNFKNINYESVAIWATLFLIALITIYPFLQVGMTTADDLIYYHLSFHKDLWPLAFAFAKDNGRFYFALVNPFYTFPYTYDNFALTKIIQYASLLLCFFTFFLVLKKIYKSVHLGLFALLFLFTTLAVTKWTSIIVCYPFYFSFSFTLILLSVLLLLHYFEKKKTKFLVFSAIIYFLGLLFYEVYLLYLSIVAIIVIGHYVNEKRDTASLFQFRKTFQALLPFIIVGVVYLTVYFTFYKIYPTNYDGNTINEKFNTEAALAILKNFPESAFPLSVFYEHQPILEYQYEGITGYRSDFFSLLWNARVEWIVKAVLTCLLLVMVILRLPRTNLKATVAASIAALILIYLSHILLTLTQKYVSYTYMKGYGPTFYSFHGVVLFFTVVCQWLYTYAQKNIVTKVLFIVCITCYFFTCSIQTSYANYYTAKDLVRGKMAFDLVEEFYQSEKFKSLSDTSIVYAKDLWDNSSAQLEIYNQNFNWGDHIYNKTKKVIYTARTAERFNEQLSQNPGKPTFIIKKQEAHKTREGWLIFAPLDTAFRQNNFEKVQVDKLSLFYYSSYKEFSLSFTMKKENAKAKIFINNQPVDSTDTNYYTVNIRSTDRSKASVILDLTAPGIDLNSIMISDILLPERPTIEVSQ